MRTFVSTPVLAVAVIFLGGLSASPLQAQEETAVPWDLAMVLLASTGPDTRLSVGSAPAGLAEALALPAGWEVTGTLERRRSGTLVATVPADLRDAVGAYGAALEEAGWEHPPEMEGFGGGFLPSNSSRVSGWCSDAYYVTSESLDVDGQSYLRIRFFEVAESPCSPDRQAERRRMMMRYDPIPRLLPPEGLRVQGGGAGGSSQDRHATAYILGETTAAELLDHYADQLADEGWEAGAGTQNAGLAALPFTFRDPDGQEWWGGLTVWAMGEGRWKVMLEAAFPDPRLAG